ncbi:hypothetical protein GUJ93_ZPchr0092g38070 [Zizania palustris]|uniref:Protein saal1 n=1 Tax=Zizania palustris TaxID=103762 RepID=A0A8J5RBP6_ZIZPA|nr:hypothetical protein GUJ93_ZPchr0092g38070 [Zizania palustris]
MALGSSSPEEEVPKVGGEAGEEDEVSPPQILALPVTDYASVSPDASTEGGALSVVGEAGQEDEELPPQRLLSSPTIPTTDQVSLPASSPEGGGLKEGCNARQEDEAPLPHLTSSGSSQEDSEAEQEGNASSPREEREAEEEQEGDVGADEEEEEEDDEEEAPTHLPFAPSSESKLPDDTTTIDPTYIISVIRRLIPQGSAVDKESSKKQEQTEERDASSGGGESTQPYDKDLWERDACNLWDLAVIEPQAELMVNNHVLEVLLGNLHVRQSVRMKEICIGIIANLACHKSLANAITSQKGLIATVVNQLFLDDSDCLVETFRLLIAIFQSNASILWAEAILPDEILSRILWIIGNTLKSTLLQKTIDFLSALIDDQDVITILIEPLIKVGLVECAISLLITEVENSLDGNKLDRSDSLDSILRLIEELSSIDNCSKVMSSNDQLIKALNSIVKLPDKFEVVGYCASVVIVLANLLADGKHLAPILSHDLALLEGLFDILPLVSDETGARNALWCILTRLLKQIQAQETIMNSSTIEQFVSLFLGRFTIIKDDIERYGIETEADSSVEGVSLQNGLYTSLRAICSITERWIADKSSLGKADASPTGYTIQNARDLLRYCRSYEP